MVNLIYIAYFVVYTAFMVGIGIYHAKRIKSIDDYLLANRKIGFWKIIGTMVATTCGAAAFIGFVGLGYISGINGIFFWVIPATLFGIIFAMFFGKILWKMKLYTIPDVFALRFGKNAAFIPSIYQIFIYSIPTLAIQYIGMGTIFVIFFGLNLKVGIILSFIIIMIYTYFGGLPAVVDSDNLQALILTVGLGLFFVLGIHYAGGFN